MIRLLSSLLLVSSLGLGAPSGKKPKEVRPPDESKIGVGHLPIDLFWIFGGLDAGYSTLSTTNGAEVDKTGMAFNVKVQTKLFSLGHFDVDLSLGGFFTSLSGPGNISGNISSPFLGLDFRYRVTERWQFGLATQWLVSSADVSFAEVARKQNIGLLIGPTLFYQFPFEVNRVRFGVQWLTDLHIPERQIHNIQGVFQIGFPMGGRPTRRYEKKINSTEVMEQGTSSIKVVLDAFVLPFDDGKAKVYDDSRRLLQHIGHFLNKNKKDWDFLMIHGHTDSGGPAKKNTAMSKKRAESVQKQLVFFGVPVDRTIVQGHGFKRLRTKDESGNGWAKNRRVELVISNVKQKKYFLHSLAAYLKAAARFEY